MFYTPNKFTWGTHALLIKNTMFNNILEFENNIEDLTVKEMLEDGFYFKNSEEKDFFSRFHIELIDLFCASF